MQVSVEESGAIERKLAICVPADEIESKVSKRLHDAARKTRIPGFRPGKAPLRIVRQRFAPGITNEVVMETIQSSYEAALNEREIIPAGLLSIEPTPYQSGKDLEFVATIEIFPAIPSLDLEGVTIRKPVVEVTAQDIDNTLADIRLRHVDNYVIREGKSEKGDKLTIDSDGKVEGESFEDGALRGYSFVLGNREMPEEFENGLVGVTQGETAVIRTSYPQSHDNPILAGKEVEYSITIKAVEQPELPELDDEFAEKMGISEGGIEKLRQEVEKNLSRELDDRLRGVMRHRVMNGLLRKNEIEAPKSLVKNEIDRSTRRLEQYMTDHGLPVSDINREHYEEEAKRQVTMGLIVQAIIDKQMIQVDSDAVKTRVNEMAASYEQPEAFIAQFMSDPEQVKRAEAVLFEEQVVKIMLETATVEEEKLSLRDFYEGDPQ